MGRLQVQERAAWRVSFPAHEITRRDGRAFEVAERSTVRFEQESTAAIELEVRAAHRDAGVPPWRPYLRETIALAGAERTTGIAKAGHA